MKYLISNNAIQVVFINILFSQRKGPYRGNFMEHKVT